MFVCLFTYLVFGIVMASGLEVTAYNAVLWVY